MKLTIKSLKGELFDLQVDEGASILILKNLIKALPPFATAQALKIIHKGKNITDSQSLAAQGLKDGDVIIAIPSKAAVVKPAPKPDQPKPSSTEPPKAQVGTKPAQTKPKPGGEGFVSTPQYNSSIQFLMGMGFPKDQCELAMKAAFFNADRAAQYLFNGIPSQPTPPVVPPGTSPTTSVPTGTVPPGGYNTPLTPILQQIQHSPQFQALRQAIRMNPSILPMMLHQLSQSNPQLFQLINSSPEEFKNWIMNGPVGQPDTGSTTIYMSQTDKEAVDRIMELGFSKAEAYQAYVAFDRDEGLAINFLLQNKDNEEGDDGDDQLY